MTGVCAFAAERVLINEVHFDPKDKRPLEFVELFNAGDAPVKLDGWKLDKFVFPIGTILDVGGYLVVAQDAAALEKEFAVKALGPFAGKLSNEGEKLVLADSAGRLVESIKYGAGFPWPTASAGVGSSLERIHPLADASRPGHWRASGFGDTQPATKSGFFLPPGSSGWKWRKGDSEPGAWTARDFKEGAAWKPGKAGFGYGDDDDATVLGDMLGRYGCAFFRHRFRVEELPAVLLLRARVDDGCVVWINGHEVARLNVAAGALTLKTLALEHEAGDWEEVHIDNPARFLTKGENVIAVQAINSALDSSDLSMDVSLALPGQSKGGTRPTPGAQNSVAAASAPPACAWVQHKPDSPKAGEPVVLSAAITDREGVQSVVAHVQFVEPGFYVRKGDADYETRWQDFALNDDGRDGDRIAKDNVWSGFVPAASQTNRRLVRYRFTATGGDGAMVRLPYADDPCPNFAYFVWNGPPAWAGASQPGKTPPIVFSAEMQKTLPIFTLVANAEDVRNSQYSGGFSHRRLTGTFVHDGHVYDHIAFHNRGSASTYESGKNKWGFKFLPAHEMPMRDQWGKVRRERWNSFAMNGCASPWVQENRGMAGLDEAISFRAYQLASVPAPDCQPVHFRIVSSEEEQGKTQFDGDLWGLYQAIEDPDGAWLKNHRLPDGITVTPEHGVQHIPGGYPGDAGREWDQFRSGPKGKPEEWWRKNMDVESYFSFHAINRLVANIDLRPGANHYFYHNPERGWMPVPWDLDMQFLPRNHQAGYIDQIRCLEVPALKLEFRNRAREIQDLLASDSRPAGGQIGQLVAEYTRLIDTKLGNWAQFDEARWNHAPDTRNKGAFYRNPALKDFTSAAKYIVDFCTDTRPKKDYRIDDKKPLGYGWGYLGIEAADQDIPARPTIKYVGPAGYPSGALGFESSAFSGKHPFGAIQWRVGEIGTPDRKPWRYEIEPVWQSPESLVFVPQVRIPQSTCKAGATYRVRVRHKDSAGRWSHWSEAAEFIAK